MSVHHGRESGFQAAAPLPPKAPFLRFRWWLLLAIPIVLLAIIAFGIWWVFIGSNSAPRSFRFRTTYYVETPSGVKAGSTVQEIGTIYFDGAMKGFDGFDRSFFGSGEPLIINLGTYGKLFVLLKGPIDSFFKIHDATLKDIGIDPDSPQAMDYYARLKGVTEIPLSSRGTHLPKMVRFRDINDPKTIELVDPLNIAASYGPGFRLLRITEEITQDPVTHEMAGKDMPLWLQKRQPPRDFNGYSEVL